ncbi:MAG: glycerophosphodiester phosphodiesterase [Alicyclobacillaceae bacterium]|nr:glycerophosphodiester phosphodiesterase [Alicyclobacillaceae bacterium]
MRYNGTKVNAWSARGGRPWVIAHRGDSARAPENTLSSFLLADAAGVDAIESDVHWSRDGELVLTHDATVDRCSNGSGPVAGLTLAELKRFDFGYRFSPDGGRSYPYRGRGVRIPTLAELLHAVPQLPLTLEIKPMRPEGVRQLLQVIADCGAERRVLLASFRHEMLAAIRREAAGMAVVTSASPREAVCFWVRAHLGVPPRRPPYAALQVPPERHGWPLAPPSVVRQAHRVGLGVDVWTIDHPAELAHWFSSGVDGVVTNDPRLALAVRDRRTDQGSGRG